jgi:hypothetical protein
VENIPFDLEGLPEPPPAKALRGAKTDDRKIAWTAYKSPKPHHCDVCLAEVHERWPNGTHAPNRAVFRRKQGTAVTFWCSVHGIEQKEKDGVGKPKTKKASNRR